jgi:hypothetical protein
MDMNKGDTAVVFIDPQNDVLSEKGLSWPLVGESVRENNTIENMERIFKTAKTKDSRCSFLPTIFFQRTADGSSTVLWRPTRRRPGCSVVPGD